MTQPLMKRCDWVVNIESRYVQNLERNGNRAMIILDTDHVSLMEVADGVESKRVRERLLTVSIADRAVTIISFEEQTRGWLAYLSRAKTVRQQVEAYHRLSRHLNMYRSLIVLDFDEHAAIEFQRLRQLRIRIGTMDLKIAAIALANHAILLSRNLRDFRMVPNLLVEDWTV